MQLTHWIQLKKNHMLTLNYSLLREMKISSHLQDHSMSGYHTQLSSLHHVSWEASVDMKAKALFVRDFSVRRWFCSLRVRYITFSISAAKTRSHFSIAPERRGLGEMTGLCQSLHARKIRVTQLHTVPQASLIKTFFITGSILGGLKPGSLRHIVNATLGIHPLLSLSFAFRLVQRKTKQH